MDELELGLGPVQFDVGGLEQTAEVIRRVVVASFLVIGVRDFNLRLQNDLAVISMLSSFNFSEVDMTA